MENKTLAERIAEERLAKQPSQPFNIRQLSKMKLRFDLAIQRNLRWTDEQGTSLIESAFLGYPIPPVYALRTPDKELWLLDGKQRLTRFVSFQNDEWALTECIVYGIDVTGMKYSELPVELQELISIDTYINVIQFDSLTIDQRDQVFKRLNNGTPLLNVELIRSILGTENLEWINAITEKPFFNIINVSDKQRDKFLDQEIVLQMIGIIQDRYGELSGKLLQTIALDLRINGIDDELKNKISSVVDYLEKGFSKYEEKERKRLLKKNDVVALAKAAIIAMKYNVDPVEFAGLTGNVIVKNNYKATKLGSTAAENKVRKRVELLIESLNINENEDKDGQLEMEV
ncbi:DUF262 domain-containing protein [Paenibacillus elgii]|uniref:DUF262 domain-containing protein n=1 Tax=Paenibacillus elgii TaxID=189691 RepID=UPI002D7D6588|nr:DUF262 domain-containing protein [Paenibacillus elgii]